ncbi:hypothetical protein L9F63_009035, partial [Diploptera punctata]
TQSENELLVSDIFPSDLTYPKAWWRVQLVYVVKYNEDIILVLFLLEIVIHHVEPKARKMHLCKECITSKEYEMAVRTGLVISVNPTSDRLTSAPVCSPVVDRLIYRSPGHALLWL